ncbi:MULTISPECIES: GUN4 domain-containing protein [Calothrix]|uniref:GUN4 domain-containing protein n=2 Tax=Calothrix TaxID=1186 RepID=A0ABR8ABN8_9CYAN|nr:MULTISPECIES: GUN4 domain-containing protein [Calothrix]MBD2197406.1 GUN4 domain-containing protein [Calothrix parietina FACHB-288]MBD2225973.1 GUN4 domain-containing protein [Calothrix anomala FACHB-343]
MAPNYLQESDIETLANLLLRSQQSRTREALCIRIGIDPQRIGFIRDSSDADFVTQLIYYLDNVGDQEALCKLCCQELFPIFNKSTYRAILEEIAVKLTCNHDCVKNSPDYKTLKQSSSLKPNLVPEFAANYPNQLDKSKPESLFIKIGNVNKKLLISGVILLLGLGGFALHEEISQTVVDPKYNALTEFLKARKWEEADGETATITRNIIGKDKAHPLYINDLKTFPCTDLRNIEQLWLKYSDKRFGFSKQKQIISNLVITQTEQQKKEDYAWKEFSNQVGWYRVISKQNAPDGHFPAIGTWWNAYEPGWLEALFSRIDACNADKDRNP